MATEESGALTRRDLLVRTGQAAAVVTGAALLPQGALAAEPDATGRARITEGTNIAAAVSPDGRWVAMDLLTAIWVLPIDGGPARRLTDDLQDATQPHWSPDGRSLVFQSYRDGNYHLWVIGADGGGLRQLTSGPFDHREPKFSPDGRYLAFASDRGGSSYGVFTYELATGAVRALTDTATEEAMPAWSPDGRRVAYTVDNTAVDAVDVATGQVTRLVEPAEGTTVFGPAFTPDGAISHVRLTGANADLVVGGTAVTRGEDVFGFAASWLASGELVYTANGQIRRRPSAGDARPIPFQAEVPVVSRRDYRRAVPDLDSTGPRPVRGIAGPVVAPDGSRIAFRALNALWLLPVTGGKPVKLVDDGYFASDPDFSPDGNSLVYSSDRAGTADLWVRDLRSGQDRRLTALPGAQLTPRWSPDGARIAYSDHDGATWVLDVASGEVKQVTPTLFMPGRPTWSPDGRVLALAAVKPNSKRFREGTSQILTVDLATGGLTYTEPVPGRSIATRGDDGPVWSPDGRMLAFTVESAAWVVDVDPAGRHLGPARQVTHEVTDSLSWAGPDRLLYLNNGRLRIAGVAGGRARTIPLDLHWRRARVRDRTVVHAGAVWDGEATALRRDVDIVIAGDRIEAVLPHLPGRSTVDASRLTVMPGLIDAHNHWHLRGRQWGDRQGRLWLAYGITTTRSPGDPAYQMVETREALDGGRRTGPRYFATGEAIDGSRIYYNFMRTTRSAEQLGPEFERARELGYDLIKTYVRLPVRSQREAVRQAHRAGLPLSSHYLYPAENIGMDGMEHTGATNRLGYSHTVSRLGRAYGDVVTLFTRSGMSVTPTLFNSAVLYADDRSLVDDRRTRALYPAWEYERLVTKAEEAKLPPAAAMREMLAANVDMVLRIHRGGGFVIAGTDAPLDNVAISLHTNLRAMVRYGFTPYEALRTATVNPARWLGLDSRLGRIAPGAVADLAFVEGDPLADIRAAAAVSKVMTGGVLHTVDDLLAPFAAPAAGAATAVATSAPATAHTHDPEYWWHEPEWVRPVCCGL
ncbi:amidohydrolase family protein [Amycolatopsis suaedae]|uniref:Amidohydrolase n=1 Tax=Amycolatopsis suaedae TaxID=2510978 RepID=A0A4Q7JCA7_9PSEU|nr:amidohydrolase family protein [Amycolatopsis suaedae]RZQ64652.1 amidohydrolase [Amycolatopsis suaedae]